MRKRRISLSNKWTKTHLVVIIKLNGSSDLNHYLSSAIKWTCSKRVIKKLLFLALSKYRQADKGNMLNFA